MIINIKNSTGYSVVLEYGDYCIYQKNADYPLAIFDTEEEALKALVDLTNFSEVKGNV